jgi:hypothetical protein
MENLVCILSVECRGEVDWYLEKGKVKEISENLRDVRLKNGELFEKESNYVWKDDKEFYSYGKFKKEFGIKKGYCIGCWEELVYYVFNVEDIKNINKLNRKLLGGWNLGYKISFKEIKEEEEKL